jgi:hypothetical protein
MTGSVVLGASQALRTEVRERSIPFVVAEVYMLGGAARDGPAARGGGRGAGPSGGGRPDGGRRGGPSAVAGRGGTPGRGAGRRRCQNREIAARLFVSVKTVEAALTRTYRKLGVRSRVDIARLAASPRVDDRPA